MSRNRNSSLRARLSRTLVGLGLASVVLLAGVNFLVVRSLLDSGVRDQLVTLRDLRRDSVDLAIGRLNARVATLASDPGVVSALADLQGAYDQLDDDLTEGQVGELESVYTEVVRPYDEAGVDRPDVDALLPDSVAGRSLHYRYIAANPEADRSDLVDAGDGTPYSAAHADHHRFLQGLASSIGASDLLLIGADSNDVVYSVQKRIDLGTDVERGPYAETGLGTAWERLGQAAVTDAVIVDTSFYLPDASAPIAHVAATVRADTEVIGAIVVEIGIDALTDIVTAGQDWDLLGLGDTGDAYIVGADGRLRTVPRAWFDGPDAYVERYRKTSGDDRIAGLMEFTGSPVLLHQIDNAAISAAIGGDEFVGIVDNGLGRRALTASAPLEVDGVDWYVITEQQTSETRDELERFVVTIAALLALLLPILALVGIVLARVFARPVVPLVEAARGIADGDFDTAVPDLGRNELGDLGRQLRNVAGQLRDQDASVAAEEQRILTMLSSVLPPDLVERVRRGEHDVADVIDDGTVIALRIRDLPEPSGAEQDAVLELTARLADEVDELAIGCGVERVRVASDQELFVAGRGQSGVAADVAVSFAIAAVAHIEAVGAEHGVGIEAHAGLSAGSVATGVLGSHQMSFGMWGAPVGHAIELGNLEAPSRVVIDASVADELTGNWALSSIDTGHPTGVATGSVFTVDANTGSNNGSTSGKWLNIGTNRSQSERCSARSSPPPSSERAWARRSVGHTPRSQKTPSAPSPNASRR